ncbi:MULTISPECIES: hypothetical protein [unclassified Shewanella]|uniref:hypothetical protein n=1 Tax=unclassified Shewanella TaxID=196818 RepID=UPI0018E478AE|nr:MULTISPECIES: hypothetical protein [unclassified Shewanella]MDO6776791.1 hypothetical protein [Shewanella sp. 3_MG-2023]
MNKNEQQLQPIVIPVHSITIPVHSTATLIKASIAAGVIAAIVLVTAILPAEYNIDPTGIGKALGLTKIAQAAEIGTVENTESVEGIDDIESAALVIVTAPLVADIKQARKTAAVRSDSVNVVIPAGKGLEYKLLLNQFTHLTYQWHTLDEAPLFFDFHGEPQGDTTGYYESYNISTANKVTGSLTTPFAGAHGWYWKNTSDAAITVVLNTTGAYNIKG